MNVTQKLIPVAFSLLMAGLLTNSALAGDCCAGCGCDDHCGKVCRLVCKEREIEVTCWASECKDVCLPCRSKKGSKHCDCVDCGKGCPKKVVWYDWCAGGAKLRTKKHLMKKTVTKKVRGYEWVVEDLCSACEAACEAEAPTVESRAHVPKPPALNAKLIYGKPVVQKTPQVRLGSGTHQQALEPAPLPPR